jgi:uncharacterized protein
MHNVDVFARHARNRIEEALTDTPVVLIHGPRQSGKSTLAEEFTQATGRSYVTLDDPIALALALRDPSAFLSSFAPPVTIDEIQRAPGLFLGIKLLVDRNRAPGSFLLTGSANVLALPKLSDSLAGRMEIIDLLPLSQGEIDGAPDGARSPRFEPCSDEDLFERVLRGGFPEAVLRSARRRSDWFQNYIRTILERDVKEHGNIEALIQMPQLISLLAARSGSALNVASVANDTSTPYTTLRRYMSLLETIFLTRTVPTWSTNRSKSVTKAPKLYMTDTGLLCHLLNLNARSFTSDRNLFRAPLENFVAMELAKQCTYGLVRPRLMHLRTVRQLEVDFVLEARGSHVVGIEVKYGHTVHPNDANGLRFLREVAGARFRRGVVLYCGDAVVPLDEKICALPINSLWLARED